MEVAAQLKHVLLDIELAATEVFPLFVHGLAVA